MDERKLKSIPLFASLSRDDLRRVAQVADEIDVSEGNESPQDSDHVRCGQGTDTLYFDKGVDTRGKGCERLFPE